MLLPLTCLNDAPGDNNNSFYFPLPLLDFLGHIHLHTTVVNFPSIQVSTVHQMYRSLLGVVSSCKKRLIDDLLRTAQIPPENRMFCPHPHCSSLFLTLVKTNVFGTFSTNHSLCQRVRKTHL